jgi:hypothetical protein
VSLLEAHGYEAVCGTPEGDTYGIPLVCWREEGGHMYGVVLLKGHLRRADLLPHFRRYGTRGGVRGGGDGAAAPVLTAPTAPGRPGGTREPALR